MKKIMAIALASLAFSACTSIKSVTKFDHKLDNQEVSQSVVVLDSSLFRKDEKTVKFIDDLNTITLKNAGK